MGDYIKCPRCELNYIHKDQKLCDVCKAELGLGPELVFAVDKESTEKFKLCPICKQVKIPKDEDMCDKCRENLDFKGDQIDYDNDVGWKEYVKDDQEDEEDENLDTEEKISLSKLAEEEEAELDKEFGGEDFEDEEFTEEKDDFEYVNPDDPDLQGDDDDEEDEDKNDGDDEE